MRRALTSLLAVGLLGLPALTGTALAHPGGTNAAGCHAGTQPYHCHNGGTGGEPVRPPAPSPPTLYADCDAVRAAGTAPLYAYQPGYFPDLDADLDGVACETVEGSTVTPAPTVAPTTPPPTTAPPTAPPLPQQPVLQRRDVTIGITQAAGVYTFSGLVTPRAAGLQVTVARLDAATKRVTGVASVKTDAAGRYVIRTVLPAGMSGFYTLTTPAPGFAAGRSILYGLNVPRPPVPKVTGRVSIAPVGIDPYEGWYNLYGNIGPCVQDKVVNIYRESNGRRALIARTQADCSDGAPHWGIAYSPGTLLGTHTYLAGIDGDARVTAALSNRVRYTYSERFEGPEGQYAAGPNGFQVVGPNYISG